MTPPSPGWPKLSKLLTEVLVIVGSILAAFAIDAAWDERNEREQEAALLSALAVDFRGAEADLDRVLAIHERIISSTDALLRASDSRSLAAADPASLQDALATLTYNPTFDPPSGTVETVLNTGRADLIENRELVRELTQWSALVRDFREDEDFANAHNGQTLYPRLLLRFNLKDLVDSGPAEWPGPKAAVTDFDVLLEDASQSMLWRHWTFHVNAARYSGRDVADAIDRILALLDGASES